ncbi:MAG: serine hydrolase [Acidobacteria bacterium]|nr:serine hydrolase [Acidobacteriota bacterium]
MRLLTLVFFAIRFLHAQALPDAEIRKIIAERIDERKEGVGIAIGVIDANGKRIVAHGRTSAKGASVDGDTIFEIGSITKVFTAIVLADMVERKEVSLDDTVSKFLPVTVKLPEKGAGVITLRDLSTQFAGLPRMPGNFKPSNAQNPYADYSPKQLYEFLASHELAAKPGEKYLYSNLGVGILGHLLTLRAGATYESLIRKRIAEPLGMSSTWTTLPPDLEKRFATGHDAALSPVSPWTLDALAGAGALRSSANDMLKFLAANLGYTKTPLASALAATVAARRPAAPALELGLGWHINTRDETEVIWHNGGTGGFRTFAGYNPKTRVGVVALSNVSTARGIDDIGMHILNPKAPLAKPLATHTEVSINSKLLDGYVGNYQLVPGFVIAVTREGDKLFIQATNQPKTQVFPESDRKFFLKVVDAQITFDVDESGKASKLTLHQNGRNLPGARLD